MGKRRVTSNDRLRRRVADEAARIMSTEGVKDYLVAKRKAAERLGVSDRGAMPRNDEIEAELIRYRQLFEPDLGDRLDLLRRTARDAMRFLEPFEPRLVGQVLSGSAGRHSQISLHLFADSPEEIDVYLIERGVPFERGTRRHRYGDSRTEDYPSYRFLAEDIPIELTVFPPRAIRQPPCSPVDGRAMDRASLAQVEALLQEPGAGEL
jgi:hypothetical protein